MPRRGGGIRGENGCPDSTPALGNGCARLRHDGDGEPPRSRRRHRRAGSGPPVKTAPRRSTARRSTARKLRAGRGKWTGRAPIAHAYAWERCDAAGAECAPIAGASSSAYRATPRRRRPPARGRRDRLQRRRLRRSPLGRLARDRRRGAEAQRPRDAHGRSRRRARPERGHRHLEGHAAVHLQLPVVSAAAEAAKRSPAPRAPATAPTTADIGKKLKAVITATNAAGSGTQRSRATAKVVPGLAREPRPAEGLRHAARRPDADAEPGTWVGTPPIAYGYQWYACSLSGCEAIAGATEQTHTVEIGEFGDSFEVEVTATNAQGSASAISEQTNLVGGNAPVNTEAPSISGTATAGQLLTASSGKWTGTEPITYEYEWLRCNTSGAECSAGRGRLGAAALPGGRGRRGPQAAREGDREKPRRQRRSRIGADRDGRGRRPVKRDRADGARARHHGADADGDRRDLDGDRTDLLRVPLAAVQQSRAPNAKTSAGAGESKYTLQNADAAHTVRVVVTAKNVAGSTEKESAVTGEVLGVGAEQHRSADSLRGSERRPAADRLEREMERDRTDHVRIRMAAVQRRRRIVRQAAAPSLLPTYSASRRRRRAHAAREGDREKHRRQRQRRIGADRNGERRAADERRACR